MGQVCEYVKVVPTDGAHLLGCVIPTVIPTGTQTTLPCSPSPTEGLLSLASLWAPHGQLACPMVGIRAALEHWAWKGALV